MPPLQLLLTDVVQKAPHGDFELVGGKTPVHGTCEHDAVEEFKITGIGRAPALILRVSSIPSISGIRMSQTTRSNFSVKRWRQASAPFAAEVTP